MLGWTARAGFGAVAVSSGCRRCRLARTGRRGPDGRGGVAVVSGAEREDAVPELLADVFLVAALVREFHDLLDGQVLAGGDVEEVPDLVEEDLLAPAAADVLA